ncbi:protein kinase domain-containing protein [Marinicella rhabdoformis]|uniref:protein kinase domain-containing protein n=1 Tax=Marinicella rhabdoformis TaxID=2580566 RepID=UPI0012AEB676|nr:protein kinase [Marinicella rhabdoformis]
MNDEDIKKLWAQIDADFESDEDLEVDGYLSDKGFKSTKRVESVSDLATGLYEKTFDINTTQNPEISDKYHIVKQLDFGGQSDIYLAERSDGVYKKTVVIKFMSQSYQHNELKQQFLQEMQLLADLNHPGVVGIIDGGLTEKGQAWLVLDYINGPHIDQYSNKHELNDKDIIKLILDLCDALEFVHRRGVFHLDIKPSNVLIHAINNIPHPVLIDFGIAQSSTQDSQNQFGTIGYSPPEIAKGQAEAISDLYATGMLLAQLLCRNATNNVGVLSRQERTALLSKNGVDTDVINIIDQATQKDKRFRYGELGIFRSDLNNYLQGLPLSFDSGFWPFIRKTISRHRLITSGLLLAGFSAVFFTAKYTHDISQLQKITLVEKQQSDELMNFMLDELFDKLKKIGRVDVLKSVTEKSVNHLAAQNPSAMSELDHLQTAKAYMNAGRVFDELELSQQGKQAYLKAKDNLKPLESLPHAQIKRENLLSEINVGLSQVLSSEGQELATETVLKETIRITEGLSQLGMLDKPITLWEAYLQLGWHYLEYGKDQLALNEINAALTFSQTQLNSENDPQWLYAHSHGLQLKAWYEIDFGSLETGTSDLISAVEYAKKALAGDPEDIKKHNNLRILLNHLGFFLLESQRYQDALPYVELAVEQGLILQSKAPKNLEYQRELAVSYSTVGEVLQQLNEHGNALDYYQKSLSITEFLVSQDKGNFSTINDLAIDSLLVANLNAQLGYQKEAKKLWQKAADLMRPIQQKEPNNKYYSHTLLVALLQLQSYQEARSLYDMVAANGMEDQQIKELLIKHQLTDWKNEKKGPE